MKAYNKILVFTLAASLLAGCNFFDNNSPSASMPDEMFSSIANTELAISGVYELFGQDRGYRNRLTCGYAGLNTDIEYCRKSSSDYARYQTKVTDTDLSNAKGSDAWGYLTTIIERCNNIVEGIDKYGYTGIKPENHSAKADSASFDYLKGEALFLRSFALLEMVKYWGDVPVNIKAYDGESLEESCSGKVDRNIAFEQIRTDLRKAAELMEWSEVAQLSVAQNDVRRPSKAAALGLLARADLMYAGKAVRPTSLVANNPDYTVDWNIQDPEKRKDIYGEVMWACDSILAHEGSKKLQKDFAKVFRDVCEDKKDYSSMEQIWVIPFADGARGQVMNYNCLKFNTKKVEGDEGELNSYSVMGVLMHNVEYNNDVKSNFSLSIVPTLLFDFEANDARREVTVLPYRWFVGKVGDIDPTITDKVEKRAKCIFPEPQSDASQWACGKYRIEWMSRDNSGADDGIDFPIIRMADIYLMYAEASLFEPNLPDGWVPTSGLSAMDCFNEVRTRAGLKADSKALTLANIQDERKFEFAGEYIRKWDLMRWGILREKMEEAHERIQEYRTDYDQQYIYFSYKKDNNVVQPGATWNGAKVERGYVMDKVYGLVESAPSSAMLPKKCNFAEKLKDDSYILYDYDHPETLESRQYWPIFATVVGASGGLLFNNYGY